jgi:hypothetical protein
MCPGYRFSQSWGCQGSGVRGVPVFFFLCRGLVGEDRFYFRGLVGEDRFYFRGLAGEERIFFSIALLPCVEIRPAFCGSVILNTWGN